jgi:hypothetical protein
MIYEANRFQYGLRRRGNVAKALGQALFEAGNTGGKSLGLLHAGRAARRIVPTAYVRRPSTRPSSGNVEPKSTMMSAQPSGQMRVRTGAEETEVMHQ